MSWEIVTLVSVLIVCGTLVIALTLLFEREDEVPKVTKAEFELLKSELITLKVNSDAWFESAKADHETIHKMAEETKKLLSQQNLAQSFRGQR